MENKEKISLEERRRKVDLDSMSTEQVELLGLEIGKKLGEICSDAQEKVNKIAKTYGIKAVVGIQFRDPTTDEIVSV